MATFFALLFLIGLVAMVVGLIKPALFNKINPTNSRIKILVGGVVINMVLLAMVGVFAPEVEKKEVAAKTEAKIEPEVKKVAEVKPQNDKAEANLGMTPEQFRQAFNKRLNDLDISIVRPLGEFNIKNGDVRDVFQVEFSNEINLTGAVNKDGMLRSITVITVPGKDYEKAMMETLLLTGISANIVNTPENRDRTGKVVIDLIDKALKNVEEDKNTHTETVGNVEYMAMASKFTGLWFSMEPPEK
ncbi:hypothetical protein B9Y25_05975 [Acinetobacter baumannii]|uniref:hypothetical protein n=1 Tax=Acinetobacter calcoaceticus/baumannii complex TaxID=909768 RepID=UPI0002BA5132|nr:MULTISPECIES: hypothetical protein [Acinetobacter calcoaceticus/baumannii complex]ATP85839.1 hypothetical protein A388_00607 [Acinetobacter baumannii]EKY1148633.1 hypothetical protein [Acinetobacter baumannii]ETQ78766.1 hypothetical protein P667_3241 [Acinetobacter baumannii UH5107]MCF4279103.1 hypothetical protein [Acinetobacter baumannii]MCF4286813.1 hypothetical protein [Acinetobacter baumannii]